VTAPDRAAVAAVMPPQRGRAVLACRCGQVLDLADMCRVPQRNRPAERSGTAILPIMCAQCARRQARLR
jgi:hypothetical protein